MALLVAIFYCCNCPPPSKISANTPPLSLLPSLLYFERFGQDSSHLAMLSYHKLSAKNGLSSCHFFAIVSSLFQKN